MPESTWVGVLFCSGGSTGFFAPPGLAAPTLLDVSPGLWAWSGPDTLSNPDFPAVCAASTGFDAFNFDAIAWVGGSSEALACSTKLVKRSVDGPDARAFLGLSFRASLPAASGPLFAEQSRGSRDTADCRFASH